jgi:hypothetical protein
MRHEALGEGKEGEMDASDVVLGHCWLVIAPFSSSHFFLPFAHPTSTPLFCRFAELTISVCLCSRARSVLSVVRSARLLARSLVSSGKEKRTGSTGTHTLTPEGGSSIIV